MVEALVNAESDGLTSVSTNPMKFAKYTDL